MVSAIMMTAVSHTVSHAQTDTLPPVFFSTPTDVCDDASYKLVFYDDFNGTTLDTTKWHDYVSWYRMHNPYLGYQQDHENWADARICGGTNKNRTQFPAIFKRGNVVVSGGTCKLKAYKQPVNWSCDTCTETHDTRYYSTGTIQTYYKYGGMDKTFNSERMEARMKMATFWKAWSCFWTWFGVHMGTNEIDITEAYGPSITTPYYMPNSTIPYYEWINSKPFNTFVMHAWESTPDISKGPTVFPYVTSHEGQANYYPNQNWWNFYESTEHKIGDWHTYRCDWDTTVLKFYLDDTKINTIYKNQNTATIFMDYFGISPYATGSHCKPYGTYNVTTGFPFRVGSESSLRFSLGIKDSQSAVTPVTTSTFLGQTEIDYVKVWQRNMDESYYELCGVPNPPTAISGPLMHCNGSTYKYMVDNPVPGATWSISGSGIEFEGASNPTWCKIKRTNTLYLPVLIYNYGDPTCNLKLRKAIKCTLLEASEIGPLVMTIFIPGISKGGFMLGATDHKEMVTHHDVDIKYKWDIKYSLGSEQPGSLIQLTRWGRYISLPPINNMDTATPYYMQWKLTKYIGTDSIVKSGIKTSSSPSFYELNNPDSLYADALITDTSIYFQTVRALTSTMMADPDEDTLSVKSKMMEIAMNVITPFIIVPNSSQQKPAVHSNNNDSSSVYDKSIVIPNPTNSDLEILFGESFNIGDSVSVYFLTIDGRGVIYEESVINPEKRMKYPTNILPSGVYIIKLNNNTQQETLRFIKY